MRVEVNGVVQEVAARDLAALLEERGFDAGTVATALNGVFVAALMRAQTPLEPGAKIEVLAPMEGG